MERWTEIRRNVLTGAMSKREACRHYDIHWLTLKKILAHEEPPGYRRVRPPRRPKVDPVLPIIQAILDADATAPKKQRHTAHRIWQRLRDEHAFRGGYTVVKDAVRELRAGRQEVFLPLAHPPGEAQVDFGFAQVVLGGVTTEVALFVLSLPYADAVSCQAFPRECTEVFLEGHARAFVFFGGVPRRIAYDNTKTAVARWEHGVREPSWSNVIALADALGVECTAFLQEPSATAPVRPGRPRKPTADSADQQRSKRPRGRPRKAPATAQDTAEKGKASSAPLGEKKPAAGQGRKRKSKAEG